MQHCNHDCRHTGTVLNPFYLTHECFVCEMLNPLHLTHYFLFCEMLNPLHLTHDCLFCEIMVLSTNIRRRSGSDCCGAASPAVSTLFLSIQRSGASVGYT
jgi:hypothetical protein